jgi:hypothetical protein
MIAIESPINQLALYLHLHGICKLIMQMVIFLKLEPDGELACGLFYFFNSNSIGHVTNSSVPIK